MNRPVRVYAISRGAARAAPLFSSEHSNPTSGTVNPPPESSKSAQLEANTATSQPRLPWQSACAWGSSMDIQRPELVTARRRKRLIGFGIVAAVVLAVTLGIGSLKPAAPVVERSGIWIDTVKRGPMLREVRGTGTLVPEN